MLDGQDAVLTLQCEMLWEGVQGRVGAHVASDPRGAVHSLVTHPPFRIGPRMAFQQQEAGRQHRTDALGSKPDAVQGVKPFNR